VGIISRVKNGIVGSCIGNVSGLECGENRFLCGRKKAQKTQDQQDVSFLRFLCRLAANNSGTAGQALPDGVSARSLVGHVRAAVAEILSGGA
jgi:hypothetical protein